MLKITFCIALFLMMVYVGFMYRIFLMATAQYITDYIVFKSISPKKNFNEETSVCNGFCADSILKDGKGIMFMETTDRMEPPSLVLCALESAARVYPDRPVVFFMDGLEDVSTLEDQYRAKQLFPALSSYDNIYFFPLRMEDLFRHTPLMPWFERTIPEKEGYWTHVSSDACRFAMMWRFGGIYMDTDVISLHPVQTDNFLAAEMPTKTSSSVFALRPFHNLTWEFMRNFVDNYQGDVWANQGPGVFTRVVTEVCGHVLNSTEDARCLDTHYLHHRCFYPLPFPQWERYYQVWAEMPQFQDSYGLHLWNFMNKKGKSMVPRSGSLVEQLYKKHCPNTYKSLM